MKCPNCSSQMFVADETINLKSHVVFFRCSLCVSEHVSSEPIADVRVEAPARQASAFLEQSVTRAQFAL